jgi:small subunit ribosomal protein S6
MRRYETIFIVRPNVAEDEIEAVINKTSSIIEGDGGTIIKIDKWGLKKLAYLIKKETQGIYVHIDYAAIPASVSELERIFRIDDKVLKYLTVKLADSCDPEAIKEELAKAEVKAEESSHSETTKDEANEELKTSEPAETSAENEAKNEVENSSEEEKA